jgi:hypothetical protein
MRGKGKYWTFASEEKFVMFRSNANFFVAAILSLALSSTAGAAVIEGFESGNLAQYTTVAGNVNAVVSVT